MNTPPRVPTRSRRWVIPSIVICVIGIPILMILIPFISFRTSNASAIRRLEAKIKENKEPLTLKELAATYPPIPDEKNGAILFLELWGKDNPEFWKAFSEGASSLPKRPEPRLDDDLPYLGANARRISRNTNLPPANFNAAKAYLQDRKEHMNGIRQALERPFFRFPVNVTNAYVALLPHLAEIKKEAQNFQIEALVATESGDIEGAIAALGQAVKLGSVGAKEPFLIGQLVGIACYQIALNGAERILTKHSLSQEQLAKLERLIEDMQIPGGFSASLITERAFALSAFDLPPQAIALLGAEPSEENEEFSHKGYRIGLGILSATGIKDADKRLMLETMDSAISLAQQDDPEALEEIEALFQNVPAEAKAFPPKVFSAMLLPALGKAATKFASLEARRRAARVAVAVVRYRLAHAQRLPESLDELVPQFLSQLPVDPFDGESLRYKRLPEGFTIYSIGVDRVDDDGTERPQRGGNKPFDDTFIVER